VSGDPQRCRICGELPDNSHADMARGESLPTAATELEEIVDGLRKCSACEAYFRYQYVYDYSAYGSDEDSYLQRLDREEAIQLLMQTRKLTDKVWRELEHLGVKDAYAQIMERLRQALESSDEQHKNERHYALLTLVDYFLATNPANLDELLEHPNSRVRSLTLYFLMSRGANEVPRFIKRLSDPIADVRNHAGWALRSRAELHGDISDAMTALTSVLASDPELDVRRQAADALAAAALQGADISASIPALTAALEVGFGVTRSAATALRNAAAQGADISLAVPGLRRCSEDEDPFHKAVREIALEALRHVEARQKVE
jgi:hypothetical protein